MDMGFSSSGFALGTGPGGSDSRFDWHGLHARLSAAHAARGSILALAQQQAQRFGSFDGHTAANLTTLGTGKSECAPAVNPTALGAGKPIAAIPSDVAGPHSSGDRGQ